MNSIKENLFEGLLNRLESREKENKSKDAWNHVLGIFHETLGATTTRRVFELVKNPPTTSVVISWEQRTMEGGALARHGTWPRPLDSRDFLIDMAAILAMGEYTDQMSQGKAEGEDLRSFLQEHAERLASLCSWCFPGTA